MFEHKDNPDRSLTEVFDHATYRKQKSELLHKFRIATVLLAVFMVIPFLNIYALLFIFDWKSGVGVFFKLLLITLSCCIAYILIKEYICIVKPICDSLGKLNSEMHSDRAKLTNLVCISLASCIILGLIAWGAISFNRLKSVYRSAVNEIRDGNYLQAKNMLVEIEDKQYRYTTSLISICDACYHYENNRKIDAYYDMQDVHIWDFDDLKEDDRWKLNHFMEKLSAEYREYVEQHSYSPHSLEEKRAPSTDDSKKSTETSISYSQKQKKKSIKTDSDPYNAKDYNSEEDFYYDHYYDFFDYYDAENYYNEHSN